MSETAIARRLSLPAIHRGNRGRAILLGGLALLVLYGIPVKLRLGHPRYLDSTIVDTAIPFLEWTIWIYLSQFPFLFLALWVTRDDVRRSHAFYAMLLSAALGLVVFALWPTIIGRQSPDLTGPTAHAGPVSQGTGGAWTRAPAALRRADRSSRVEHRR